MTIILRFIHSLTYDNTVAILCVVNYHIISLYNGTMLLPFIIISSIVSYYN